MQRASSAGRLLSSCVVYASSCFLVGEGADSVHAQTHENACMGVAPARVCTWHHLSLTVGLVAAVEMLSGFLCRALPRIHDACRNVKGGCRLGCGLLGSGRSGGVRNWWRPRTCDRGRSEAHEERSGGDARVHGLCGVWGGGLGGREEGSPRERSFPFRMTATRTSTRYQMTGRVDSLYS